MELIPIWNTPRGLLSTVSEGSIVNIALDYINPLVTPITVSIIAGTLPDGLLMNSSGVISGTVVNVPVTTNYDFVVRLSNANGIVDRDFRITASNITASWTDPTNLGSVKHESYYEYGFLVTDPGFSRQEFLKIGGSIPQGLSLSRQGRLSGLIAEIESNTTYDFTIRALLDGTAFADRDFELTVTTTGNRAPVWSTPAGKLGDITNTVPFSIQVHAGDADSHSIVFSQTGLPAGFSINGTTGVISGTLSDPDPFVYSFSVTAADGFSSSSRIFSFNANDRVEYPITWVTDDSLGTITEGEKSLLNVTAVSESAWVRYELESGALPAGLSIDVNTGNIWGVCNAQVNTDSYFSFSIRAYNSTNEESKTFILRVLNRLGVNATRAYIVLTGDDRLMFNDLFITDEIDYDDIFLQGNAQFGLVESPKIVLIENLDAPTPAQVYNTLLNVEQTFLVFGEVEVGITDDYEVLYRRAYDSSEGALKNFTHPQTSTVIKPGSVDNLRDRLLELETDGDEILQPWMESYVPALVFAYVKPGTGQKIADKINKNDVIRQKLLGRRVRIDRIVLEPTTGSAFEPFFIKYDDQF